MRGLWTVVYIAVAAAAATGCNRDVRAVCDGRECVCARGDDCEFDCFRAPCDVTCMDGGTHCAGVCADGECRCWDGASCAFDCLSAPCHVDCDGAEACGGVCADGDCRCGPGTACSFDCLSGPCHVQCDGGNPQCDGVCANGTCTCGPDSTCRFTCLDDDCHIVCAPGAACVLECPRYDAGAQRCSFSSCASGQPVVCADGRFITCGAPCPE